MGRAPWQRHCQSHLHGARAVLVDAPMRMAWRRRRSGRVESCRNLRADMVRTMKLLGCSSIADLNESYLNVPPNWPT